MNDKKTINTHTPLLTNIRNLFIQGRKNTVQAVNSIMVQTYWEIGRLIVEDEQHGDNRAKFGKRVLQTLSAELTKEFGKYLKSSIYEEILSHISNS